MTHYATMFPDESKVRPKPVCTYDDEPGPTTRKTRHTDALFNCSDGRLVREFYRLAAEEDLLESLGGGHESVHLDNGNHCGRGYIDSNGVPRLEKLYMTETWYAGVQL